jgi:hypothetical protein
MAFRFKEKDPPASYCSHLAGTVHVYDPDRLLDHSYLMDDFRPGLYGSFLLHSRNSNCKLFIFPFKCLL